MKKGKEMNIYTVLRTDEELKLKMKEKEYESDGNIHNEIRASD